MVSPADVETARALAARRRAGEPLQYVLGHWAFRALDLLVDQRVLIPRPETEQVVEVALGELGAGGPCSSDRGRRRDGIGGHRPLAGHRVGPRAIPARPVWATDASPEALAVARANRGPGAPRSTAAAVLPVEFVQGNWLGPLPPRLRGAVDLVVSNPPYVSRREWPDLPGEVRCEPVAALVAV